MCSWHLLGRIKVFWLSLHHRLPRCSSMLCLPSLWLTSAVLHAFCFSMYLNSHLWINYSLCLPECLSPFMAQLLALLPYSIAMLTLKCIKCHNVPLTPVIPTGFTNLLKNLPAKSVEGSVQLHARKVQNAAVNIGINLALNIQRSWWPKLRELQKFFRNKQS